MYSMLLKTGTVEDFKRAILWDLGCDLTCTDLRLCAVEESMIKRVYAQDIKTSMMTYRDE